MWKKMIALLALTAVVTLPAQARGYHHHRGGSNSASVAAVGGLIAGLIIADAVTRPSYYPSSVVVRDSWDDYAYRSGGWNYGSYRRHGGYGYRNDYRPYRSVSQGKWTFREVRVWVPGQWERVTDRYGVGKRVWRNGYYDVRHEKVWVPRYRY